MWHEIGELVLELNSLCEHWEPSWLFLILALMLIVEIKTYEYTKREWKSSQNLEITLGKVLSKQVKRLEETHYEMVKKLVRKKRRKK